MADLRFLRMPLTALAAAGALTVVPASAPAAPAGIPPGFQVDLGASVHIECFTSQPERLRCLNYGARTGETSSASCSFGGAVATVVLRRTGGKVRTRTCVDEGYHHWRRLTTSRPFRHGPFSCTVDAARTALRCRNASGRHTIARSRD